MFVFRIFYNFYVDGGFDVVFYFFVWIKFVWYSIRLFSNGCDGVVIGILENFYIWFLLRKVRVLLGSIVLNGEFNFFVRFYVIV